MRERLQKETRKGREGKMVRKRHRQEKVWGARAR
jgi:hypothetical protein